jgi:hypothetical protein
MKIMTGRKGDEGAKGNNQKTLHVFGL